MKKLGLLTAVVALGMFMFSVPAMAAPLLNGAGQNEFYYKNVENWVDRDGSGTVSVGDHFFGIMNVQNIDTGGSPLWAQDLAPVDQLSGYFLTEVTSIALEDTNGDGVNDQSHIGMGASTVGDLYAGLISNTELGGGVVMKLYTDDQSAGGPGTLYTTAGSIAGDITAATDGNLWADLAINGNGYWYTHSYDNLIPPTNPAQWVGDSMFGLNFYTNATGYTFNFIDDPLEAETGANTLVQMYGTSNVNVNGGNAGAHWAFTSDDPSVVVTPEPSTFILLGSGLIGAALIRRKRKMKKS